MKEPSGDHAETGKWDKDGAISVKATNSPTVEVASDSTQGLPPHPPTMIQLILFACLLFLLGCTNPEREGYVMVDGTCGEQEIMVECTAIGQYGLDCYAYGHYTCGDEK